MIPSRDVADMAEDRSIIGHTIELTYESGVNSTYPIRMTFTGYHETTNGDTYIDYILHNPNTEDYRTPKPFEFQLREFVQSFVRRSYDNQEGERIRVVSEVQTWEL